MTELKQLRDFAEQINGIRPTERSLKGVVNNLIGNYNPDITFNEELQGNEPFALDIKKNGTTYDLAQNPIKVSSIITYNEDGGLTSFFAVATIILSEMAYTNLTDCLNYVKVIVKNETDDEIIETSNLTVASKSLKFGGITWYQDRLQDNTRYFYKKLALNSDTSYLLSEKTISFTFIIDVRTGIFREGTDKEFAKAYSYIAYFKMPEIPNPNEVENNAKGGTRSIKTESSPIQEMNSVDLDNDEK